MSWLTDPDEEWSTDGGRPSRYATPSADEPAGGSIAAEPDLVEPDEFHPEERPPRSPVKLAALIVGGWVAVSVVVLLVLLAVRGPNNSTPKASIPPSPAAQPTAGATTLATPDGWALVQSDDQTNCAAHSYGLMTKFLTTTPCTSVHRELLSTVKAGKTIVVADYVVTFDTDAQAAQFNAYVKTDGTGNISDLLREGVKLDGAAVKLSPNAAFTSQQVGAQVRVAEAAYTVGATAAKDQALAAVAQEAIAG